MICNLLMDRMLLRQSADIEAPKRMFKVLNPLKTEGRYRYIYKKSF